MRNKIGLLFNISNENNKNYFIINIPIKKNINPKFYHIIGFERISLETLLSNISNSIEIDSKINIKNIIIIKNKTKYSKISLSDKTSIDFENNLFWVNPKKYKNLKENFIEIEKELKKIENNKINKKIIIKLQQIFENI
jgi:hypothetical protein